jgi:hypothetical protein
MSIAPTLERYLTAENIQYDVIPHDPTMSKRGNARRRESGPTMSAPEGRTDMLHRRAEVR